ncbi:helix-turn-helix domain-containing protein [Clostridium oryzae]|uniref:Transposon Tn10 TetD protein n=1 Tax=Clostridium oryzae TaxID=1450648 RepID=A0A1V4ISV9_9CLOT|nr:AraC family transcriptional regulator [Clostridium oryzae]OPJ62885.1 transposon Tn10 TetD protein [Clostridium oryzae]
MNNINIIQNSLDFIEKNIRTDISVSELANSAGFSIFHYYRIFNKIVGMPVMQYVTMRKLINAIYEIRLGKKMVEAALTYGFDTHAGFFKAFKREYDCSLTEYLKNHKVMKPYRINLKQEQVMITDKKIKVSANFQKKKGYTLCYLLNTNHKYSIFQQI